MHGQIAHRKQRRYLRLALLLFLGTGAVHAPSASPGIGAGMKFSRSGRPVAASSSVTGLWQARW
jgi:hypothetical protein